MKVFSSWPRSTSWFAAEAINTSRRDWPQLALKFYYHGFFVNFDIWFSAIWTMNLDCRAPWVWKHYMSSQCSLNLRSCRALQRHSSPLLCHRRLSPSRAGAAHPPLPNKTWQQHGTGISPLHCPGCSHPQQHPPKNISTPLWMDTQAVLGRWPCCPWGVVLHRLGIIYVGKDL